jgi:hypothetical protein
MATPDDEARRMGKATRNRIRATCLDCGRWRMVTTWELGRRARVRCLHCGGPTEVSQAGSERMAEGQHAADLQRERRRSP